jgi:hypothetical protein
VHYNLQLLPHYCEESKMDKAYNTWDNNPKEDNLEDGSLVLEQLESAIFNDDDCGEIPPPSTTMVILIETLATWASCLVPLPSTQLPLVSTSTLALARLPHGGSRGNRGGAKRKEK